jgi:hypothetical protein
VYGSRSTCPSFQDSLELYQNTLEVLKFYEKNPAYQKIRSVAVKTEKDRKDVFDRLQNARRLFHLVRQYAQDSSKTNTKRPSDISYSQYYTYINEHRFKQRELENQIINTNSAFPLYDNRISPLVVNEYKNIDQNSDYIGDLVNIPLYVPLIIKPSKLLTPKEKETREELLRKIEDNDLEHLFDEPEKGKVVQTSTIEKKENTPAKEKTNEAVVEMEKSKKSIQPDSTQESKSAFVFDKRYASPVYYYNQYGSGSIIGFSMKQYFMKLKPEEYDQYVLPKSARDFLSDEDRILRWLRAKYGNYYTFFL